MRLKPSGKTTRYLNTSAIGLSLGPKPNPVTSGLVQLWVYLLAPRAGSVNCHFYALGRRAPQQYTL